jgi:hypothetical protein
MSERILLQREVDLAARALVVKPFKVAPSQILALKTFDFVGDGYAEIGTGLLPFSVTHPDATLASARRMLSEDRARAETFDMSGEGANGAFTTSDANCLQNNKGYIVADWMEAHAQARSYATIVGALLGTGHHCVLNYNAYLSRLDEMESRLRWELDSTHGQRLGSPLMVFHTQLIWRSWFVKQLATGQTRVIAAPNFCHGMDVFDMHNNLSWLPSVSNVPALQALTNTSRTSGGGGRHQRGGGNSNQPAQTTPTNTASVAPTTAAPDGGRRDPGRPVRNTDRDTMFTGNTPFAASVRTHRVQHAITLVPPPSTHARWGVRLHVRLLACKRYFFRALRPCG